MYVYIYILHANILVLNEFIIFAFKIKMSSKFTCTYIPTEKTGDTECLKGTI